MKKEELKTKVIEYLVGELIDLDRLKSDYPDDKQCQDEWEQAYNGAKRLARHLGIEREVLEQEINRIYEIFKENTKKMIIIK